MISTWRLARRTRRKDQSGTKKAARNPNLELSIPTHFRCPITLDVMKDPVTLSTGITYDRQSIEAWLDAGNCTCPVTNQVLKNTDQIPNHALRRMIQDWCVDNRSFGIERIPTPRIPITTGDVSETLFEITATSRSHDHVHCRELVHRIRIWGKESDRNKKCIIASGTGRVVSAAFGDFAAASTEDCYMDVMEEILSLLTWMLPLDVEARSRLGSHASLLGLVRFLKCGNLAARRSAVLAIRELVSSEKRHLDVLAEIEGSMEALVKLIKEPICPTTTKASLVTIFCLVSSSPTTSNEKIAKRFVEMDLVSFLLDIVLDSDKSVCEKALAVLNGICDHPLGREKAYDHALTMPVLVKKVFRVSDLATEFVVSVLWKLCKNYKREEGEFLVEGLQVGAFQKLLLLLQVGCDDRTKEKATDLLKLLNVYRSRLECIDSVDFKDLKRPF